MSEQAIVAYTEIVAKDLARTYAGAPFDELVAWVRIAHQREAMVTQLYALSCIDARLGRLDASGPASVVHAAVSSIWAHEESHTRFLGSLRSLTESLTGFVAIQGRLEGLVTRSAASGGLLARALIAVGASLGGVPDFAKDLHDLDLRALLRFHGELETTARMGYDRILELLRALDAEDKQAAEQALGFTFDLDLAKIRCEESFHQDAFDEIVRWVAPDGKAFSPIDRAVCARTLRDLCERNLSVSAVRRTAAPSKVVDKGDEPPRLGCGASEGWVSDGGLGKLFADYGLAVPVVGTGPVLAGLRG